jgi:hypothetical protein
MRMTRSASTRFKAWNIRPGSHDAALAMLQCNLLCTGVTRGKRLVDAGSTEETVGVAVRNVSERRLWSTGGAASWPVPLAADWHGGLSAVASDFLHDRSSGSQIFEFESPAAGAARHRTPHIF